MRGLLLLGLFSSCGEWGLFYICGEWGSFSSCGERGPFSSCRERGSFSSCGERGPFSSCGERGLFSSCGVQFSRCGGFPSCGFRALEHSLSGCCPGSVTLRHVGPSWTRDRTHVSCVGRWILILCATREAPDRVSARLIQNWMHTF